MPAARGRVEWQRQGIAFTVSCYVTELVPPLDLIVSARAIVSRGGAVFVFEDDAGVHVLPGGRREGAEPLRQALSREIREEVGCAIIGDPHAVGFIQFEIEGARPENYRYPYPSNFHEVFAVEGGEITSAPVDPYVRNGRFVPRSDALALPLPWAERVFLAR